MAPVVSIIVNCYNQARYLERAVKSVLGQTFTDLECLIVDDGSTDNTREISEHLMTLDPRVKYYGKENGGLPSARNFGVEKARGEWIQCLDADDWIHEDKTRFQLSYLTGHENEDIVFYCDYERVFIDKDENISDRQTNTIGALNKEEFIQRLLMPDFLSSTPHPALQQAMLMRKSIFSTKYPEHLKAMGDRYFALDILTKEVSFIYTPIVGTFYTKHQGNRTNNWNYIKNYYIIFYETVQKEHKDLLPLCQIPLEFFLDETIREKDKNNFDRLLPLIQTPVYLLDKKIKVDRKSLLKLVYSLRLAIPNFLLYDKYRGPRSKKIMSFLSKILGSAS